SGAVSVGVVSRSSARTLGRQTINLGGIHSDANPLEFVCTEVEFVTRARIFQENLPVILAENAAAAGALQAAGRARVEMNTTRVLINVPQFGLRREAKR